MQNTRQLPFYHPDSVALPSPCSPWSPPSSAGRCRSAGQWLARHSCPCTPRAHQSRASCCPRSLPPGRTCHRISASAWRGCQSPCSWRRLALPRRSTCLAGVGRGGLWGFSGSSSTDAQSLSCFFFFPSSSRPDSRRLWRFSSAGGRTESAKKKKSVNAAWKHSHCRESNTPGICGIWTNIRERWNLPLPLLWSHRSANSSEMLTHESKLASKPAAVFTGYKSANEMRDLALWKTKIL